MNNKEKQALSTIADLKCFCTFCYNLQVLAAEEGLQAVIDKDTMLCGQTENIKDIACRAMEKYNG